MAAISRKRVVAPSYEPSGMDEFSAENEKTETTSKPTKSTRPSVTSGWGSSSNSTERVKAPYLVLKNNGKRIVKILDDQPMKYKRHYVASRRGFFNCEGGCPKCEVGMKVSYGYSVNVVDMAEPTEVKIWSFGPEVERRLRSFLDDEREEFRPDGIRRYFHVYHQAVEGRNAPSTQVDPMKDTDLQEDYNMEPLSEFDLNELMGECFGAEAITFYADSFLQGVADELQDKDFPKGHDRNPN